MKNWNAEELRSANAIYEEIGLNAEFMENDISCDYLTVNKARNGKIYVWYFDETKNAICEVGTNEVITDSIFIEEQFC